jgi:hypothetical protein
MSKSKKTAATVLGANFNQCILACRSDVGCIVNTCIANCANCKNNPLKPQATTPADANDPDKIIGNDQAAILGQF